MKPLPIKVSRKVFDMNFHRKCEPQTTTHFDSTDYENPEDTKLTSERTKFSGVAILEEPMPGKSETSASLTNRTRARKQYYYVWRLTPLLCNRYVHSTNLLRK